MPQGSANGGDDLPTALLKSLKKVELADLPEMDDIGLAPQFRFEQNILSAAGMTHERELQLVKDLVGEERWREAVTPPKEAGEGE